MEMYGTLNIISPLAQSIWCYIGPLHEAADLLTDNNPNNDVDVCSKLDAFINRLNRNQQHQGGITPEQVN